MDKLKQSIALAKLLKWTDEQIAAVIELQGLKKEYNSLQKKESFSGWERAGKIEKQEEIVDKLMDGNMASYELPKYLSMTQIGVLLNNEFEKEERFFDELSKIMKPDNGREIMDYMMTTDYQRTEALLKALDAWEK